LTPEQRALRCCYQEWNPANESLYRLIADAIREAVEDDRKQRDDIANKLEQATVEALTGAERLTPEQRAYALVAVWRLAGTSISDLLIRAIDAISQAERGGYLRGLKAAEKAMPLPSSAHHHVVALIREAKQPCPPAADVSSPLG
jgi:hypothetical protein